MQRIRRSESLDRRRRCSAWSRLPSIRAFCTLARPALRGCGRCWQRRRRPWARGSPRSALHTNANVIINRKLSCTPMRARTPRHGSTHHCYHAGSLALTVTHTRWGPQRQPPNITRTAARTYIWNLGTVTPWYHIIAWSQLMDDSMLSYVISLLWLNVV
jgi:hypothetical protein